MVCSSGTRDGILESYGTSRVLSLSIVCIAGTSEEILLRLHRAYFAPFRFCITIETWSGSSRPLKFLYDRPALARSGSCMCLLTEDYEPRATLGVVSSLVASPT